jgi:hypothetical protein
LQALIDLNGPLHSNWVGLLKLVSQPITNKQLVQLTSKTMTLNKTLKEILRDINTQVLETKYVINLGQLLKIVPYIKWYIFKLIKPIQLVQLERVQAEPTCATIVIDHQMVVIQVQVGNNFIDDVLIDGGFGVNIIIENLRIQLSLSKPNPKPYNLRMVDQTIAKPLGFIKDLKIFVHGIPYTFTFSVINNNVLYFSYSMLFGPLWLKDAKVSHD